MPDRGMTTSFLRRKALEFDEADADGDQEVSLEEFVRFILPLTGERSESDLKEWFFLMDVDGDGLLRKDEFFLYALCAASRKSGTGITQIFEAYDKDGSGNLDVIEFESALEEMGFGDIATDYFEEHACHDGSSISYLTLLKQIEEKTSLPAMRQFLMALATDAMLTVDTSTWAFDGSTPEEARRGLADLLKRHNVRLSDLFQRFDDDGSFSLTLDELTSAFWELGCEYCRALNTLTFSKSECPFMTSVDIMCFALVPRPNVVSLQSAELPRWSSRYLISSTPISLAKWASTSLWLL